MEISTNVFISLCYFLLPENWYIQRYTDMLGCLPGYVGRGHLNLTFCFSQVNPLPDNNILDWSKLKQIADNILNTFKMKIKCRIG